MFRTELQIICLINYYNISYSFTNQKNLQEESIRVLFLFYNCLS